MMLSSCRIRELRMLDSVNVLLSSTAVPPGLDVAQTLNVGEDASLGRMGVQAGAVELCLKEAIAGAKGEEEKEAEKEGGGGEDDDEGKCGKIEVRARVARAIKERWC